MCCLAPPCRVLVLREADCPLDKMKYVFLEANGQITVLREESSST